MKVFISWSGTTSRAVAEAVHWWIPKVLQGVSPWISSKDIDKGANWTVELARELETTDFGVLCLTPENLASAWLNYEAGAISRSVESRVCPVLHGVNKGNVSPPLSQLQLTSLDREDMYLYLMMKSMNAVLQKVHGSCLSDEDLRDTVDIWWPRLEERLNAIPVAAAPLPLTPTTEPAQPETTTEEMLAELLRLVRNIDRRSLYALNAEAQAPSSSATARRARLDQELWVVNTLPSVFASCGIKMSGAAVTDDAIRASVQNVPSPLPIDAHNVMSDVARAMGKPLIISDGTRTVKFDESGWSDEPPF